MSLPVDLANLRSMTDGDVEMEKALFEEFYSSVETCAVALQAAIAQSDAEAWRKEAHALKGVALNLGAEKLGNLCKHAQENYATAVDEKQKMLGHIEDEYRQVKQFLQALPGV